LEVGVVVPIPTLLSALDVIYRLTTPAPILFPLPDPIEKFIPPPPPAYVAYQGEGTSMG